MHPALSAREAPRHAFTPAAVPIAGRTSIILADAQALFREAVRQLLHEQPDFRVVGEASHAAETIRLAETLRPSVVLVDLDLPGMAGLAPLQELSCLEPAVHTLVLATRASDSEIVDAVQMGARGVIMRETATALLFKSLRTVSRGQYWIGRECVSDLIDKIRGRERTMGGWSPVAFGLTAREMELVAAIVEGCANSDIAAQFKISSKTVKHHLTNIFSKVGVSNRLELAMFAVQHRQAFQANRVDTPAARRRA